MGCSQSSSARGGSGRYVFSLSQPPIQRVHERGAEGLLVVHERRRLSDSDGVQLRLEYAARTVAAPGKGQDRYVLTAHGTQAFTCGICDGHSVHDISTGKQHAETAAHHLGSELWRKVHEQLAPIARDGTASEPLRTAATECFMSHQRRCEMRYDQTVRHPLEEQKQQLEEQIGESLPLELPQEGGTTATALLLHSRGLLAAWVGDSRAIVAVDGTHADPCAPWRASGGRGRRLRARVRLPVRPASPRARSAARRPGCQPPAPPPTVRPSPSPAIRRPPSPSAPHSHRPLPPPPSLAVWPSASLDSPSPPPPRVQPPSRIPRTCATPRPDPTRAGVCEQARAARCVPWR